MMSTMFLWRNKKIINTFDRKSVFYIRSYNKYMLLSCDAWKYMGRSVSKHTFYKSSPEAKHFEAVSWYGASGMGDLSTPF